MIQSFNDQVLERISKIAPEIELHKLFYGNLFGFGVKRKNLNTYEHISAFNSLNALTSEKYIKEVHSIGKKVNVWTVNKQAKMNAALQKGVDGIITDRPDLLIELKSKE